MKPMNVATAPRPARARTPSPLANNGDAISTSPTARSTKPKIWRLRELAEVSASVSRNAASGGTREARTAGAMLATTVTTMPMITDQITELDSTTSPLLGSASPPAPSAAINPAATKPPRTTPIADAITPMNSASTVIERST